MHNQLETILRLMLEILSICITSILYEKLTADYNLICTLEKPLVARSPSQVQIQVDNFVIRYLLIAIYFQFLIISLKCYLNAIFRRNVE